MFFARAPHVGGSHINVFSDCGRGANEERSTTGSRVSASDGFRGGFCLHFDLEFENYSKGGQEIAGWRTSAVGRFSWPEGGDSQCVSGGVSGPGSAVLSTDRDPLLRLRRGATVTDRLLLGPFIDLQQAIKSSVVNIVSLISGTGNPADPLTEVAHAITPPKSAQDKQTFRRIVQFSGWAPRAPRTLTPRPIQMRSASPGKQGEGYAPGRRRRIALRGIRPKNGARSSQIGRSQTRKYGDSPLSDWGEADSDRPIKRTGGSPLLDWGETGPGKPEGRKVEYEYVEVPPERRARVPFAPTLWRVRGRPKCPHPERPWVVDVTAPRISEDMGRIPFAPPHVRKWGSINKNAHTR